MILGEFVAIPLIAFFLTFTVGYIMISLFALFRKMVT